MEDASNEAIVRKKRGKVPLIIFETLLSILLACYLTLCFLAYGRDTIYPGRSMFGVDVGGLTVAEATVKLEREFPGQPFTVQTFMEGGESAAETFSLTYAELGASLDYPAAAQAAHQRFPNGNFLFDGWTYLRCLLAGEDIWSDVNVDEAVFRPAAARLLGEISYAPVDSGYVLGEDRISVTKAKDGQEISAVQGGDTSFEPTLRQALSNSRTCVFQTRILPTQTLSAQDIYDEVAGELKNAGFDPVAKAITPEHIGADFDIPAAQSLLNNAQPGEVVAVPAKIEFPAVTAEVLEKVLFRDVLGTYTTHVGGSAGRVSNVRLSAASINEFVLNAGEIFAYNAVVGERTLANGYQPAPAYVKGETVDEIGGGICQTSSTLYYAVLLSNLEIVERYAHRYVPAYIPWGMDATVSWGGPEFRFCNNTLYPIKIVAAVTDKNYLTITVYGTKTDDITVKMTNKVLSTTPFKIVRQDDPTLAPGKELVKITPYTGYKVEAYRSLYDGDGKLISHTRESVSNYKVRNQLILVGPTPATPETPPEELPAGGDAELPADLPQNPVEPEEPQEPSIPPNI